MDRLEALLKEKTQDYLAKQQEDKAMKKQKQELLETLNEENRDHEKHKKSIVLYKQQIS